MVSPHSLVSENTLLVIAGPTAVGKTSVAIDVAQRFESEIISADSRQFYRELKIGTAAPDTTQLALVPHHFVGNLSLSDSYNVSQYETEVLELLNRLFQKHKLVVLTGGSGLYIRAVCDGIDMLPDAEPEIRLHLQTILKTEGLPTLRLLLQKLDPVYFQMVDVANPARIIRALEVCMSTGLPYSSFRKKNPAKRNFRIIKIGLDLPRAELHQRINARVDQMMAAGLEQEAREFYPYRHLNALNTVGYKELFDYFDGNCSQDDAVEKIKTNTRRYARRQITWFRKENDLNWCKPDVEEVMNLVTILLNS
ncbi:MAG: tRNA (adenosine(37)-N6)-dimethylallyltransferase MiaA [Lentimicrobiaceae bacterium]|nr:tRNA (adenosine(37)-N6)-dimethylallyltransferase MiaA [Lentimicrobiaceae bacterium]MCO5267175.1 tRNA (adenosine(37)-N6)-dimethylallyltransferase MiaA [Lentimicrobium sp.]